MLLIQDIGTLKEAHHGSWCWTLQYSIYTHFCSVLSCPWRSCCFSDWVHGQVRSEYLAAWRGENPPFGRPRDLPSPIRECAVFSPSLQISSLTQALVWWGPLLRSSILSFVILFLDCLCLLFEVFVRSDSKLSFRFHQASLFGLPNKQCCSSCTRALLKLNIWSRLTLNQTIGPSTPATSRSQNS